MSSKRQKRAKYCVVLHQRAQVTQGYKIAAKCAQLAGEAGLNRGPSGQRRGSEGISGFMNAAPHLLIVDDDKEFCSLLSKILEPARLPCVHRPQWQRDGAS